MKFASGRHWQPVIRAAFDTNDKPCGPTSTNGVKRNVKGNFATQTEAALVSDLAKIWHNSKTPTRQQVSTEILQEHLNFPIK